MPPSANEEAGESCTRSDASVHQMNNQVARATCTALGKHGRAWVNVRKWFNVRKEEAAVNTELQAWAQNALCGRQNVLSCDPEEGSS